MLVTPSSPYLPDIFQAITGRVSDKMNDPSNPDPFPVFFEKGIYSQVGRDLIALKQSRADNNLPLPFPLVWFVMNYTQTRGDNGTLWGEAKVRLLLFMPTLNTYTQQEREDNTFKPRLLPLYDNYMQEVLTDKNFQFAGSNRVKHSPIIRPYWGGGDTNGADTPNLFGQFVDAIDIQGLQLQIKLPAFTC